METNRYKITETQISPTRTETLIEGRKLKPGEEATISVPVPKNAQLSRIEMDGFCSCGGKLEPSKTEEWTWVCQRDKWWNFWNRKHAKLKLEMQELPPSQGNA